MNLERIKSLDLSKTGILLIDVQNSEIDAEHEEKYPWYYQQIINVCLPNMKRIIEMGRSFGMEIIYTTIESLTSDGRDRSLDHKLSNIFIPKNSHLGKVIEDVYPEQDEIWLKKTSSGVFNSTNIDYLLRNLQITYLVIMGMLTDQCVDMGIRDAADKGYHVICISDACTTHTHQRHHNALNAFQGYCTTLTTQQFIQRIKGFSLESDPNLSDQKNNLIIKKELKLDKVKPMSLTTLITTDLIGITRGRSIPTSDLHKYVDIGCGWVPANSALTPQNEIDPSNPWNSHGDLRLLPDENSRVTIPNGPDERSTPFDYIHCDIIETNGKEFDCCPRTLLKKEIQIYQKKLGMKINVAFEHEFYLSHNNSNPSFQSAFSLQSQREQNQFSSWLMSSLQSANVQPEMFLSEFGQNQYEITCSPEDPLTAADRAVNIREITRDIARQINLNVSFSPLLSVGSVSNGVHLHLSVDDLQGKSLFYDEQRPFNLSLIGEYWSAGIVEHINSLCAITAPTPVSYFRLKPDHWSSAYSCIGYRNREAILRICPIVEFSSKSPSEQFNLEYRPMDGTSSPHLSLLSILCAGRFGIENQLRLNTIISSNPNQLTENERLEKKIFPLPDNLHKSLEHLANNQQFLTYFPKLLVDNYISIKRKELFLVERLTENELCQHYSQIY